MKSTKKFRKPCVFHQNSSYLCNWNIHLNKLYMKKVIVSAMMIMAFLCSTTTVSAQSDNKPKAKKECCDKKAEKKDCCKKKAEKKADCCKKDAEKKDCCKKKAEKAGCGADCKKCTECKATCSDTNCKDCKHKGQCKKNCKK